MASASDSLGCATAALSGVSARVPTSKALRFFHQEIFNYKSSEADEEQVSKQNKEDASAFNLPNCDAVDPNLLTIVKVVYEAFADAGLSLNAVKESQIALYFDYQETVDGKCSAPGELRRADALAKQVVSVFQLQSNKQLNAGTFYRGLQALSAAVTDVQNRRVQSALVLTVDVNKSSEDSTENQSASEKPLVCAVVIQNQEGCKRIYASQLNVSAKVSDAQKCLEEVKGCDGNFSYLEIHYSNPDFELSSMINNIAGDAKSLLVNCGYNEEVKKNSYSVLLDIIQLIWSAENKKLWPQEDKHSNLTAGDVKSGITLLHQPTPWTAGQSCLWYTDGINVSNCLQVKFAADDIDTKVNQAAECSQKQPKIFLCGATSQQALTDFLEKSRVIAEDLGFHQLMQQSASTSMSFRGYRLLNTSDDKMAVMPSDNKTKRPVWFLLPGVGCAWPGMARDMMKIPLFKETILKCSAVVSKIDTTNLYDNIMNGDEKLWENVRYSLTGICAIQIALIDLLAAIGIKPDGIIGHSLGEVVCAYADGCATLEEVMSILAHNGVGISQLKRPHGKLAVVSMTWEECKAACPDGVYPICHNTEDSVTITGKLAPVNKFMAKMKAKGVRTTAVGFSIYPHCPIAKEVLKEMNLEEKVKSVTVQKRRTSRWISTCYPEDMWGEEEAQHFGHHYYIRNYLNPVLFHDGVMKIPRNAIIIEIAPRGIFKNLMKKTLGDDILHVTLMERNEKDTEVFMSALGTLYNNGVNFDPLGLYPDIQFPVKSGTPMTSPYTSKLWNMP